MAVNSGIIKQSGAWFSYNGEKISQGKENLIEKIEQDPQFFRDIYEKVKQEAEVKIDSTGADLKDEEGLGE